ncbi:MAG: hypothetical protein KME13_23350 [Myxacorys californica WJT36-NPBG1]|jgi:hypothetical protein|nr:hypothetical protein [Myxacorys californica WJT36-NPBG1]
MTRTNLDQKSKTVNQGQFERTKTVQTQKNCSTSSNPRQLGLFTEFTPDLVIDRVERPEFEGERFYLCFGGWTLKFELTRNEAYRAIELLGSDRDAASIWNAIEQAIDGGEA